MRSSWPSLAHPPGKWANSSTRGVACLLGLLALVYSAQWIVDRGEIRILEQWFALSVGGLMEGQIWQVVTYALLNPQPIPVVFLLSLTLLFLAGRELEPILGARDFLRLAFATIALPGCLAGLAVLAGLPSVPVFGSLGLVVGVAVGYTTILPDLDISFFRWQLKASMVTALTFGMGGAFALLGLFFGDLTGALPLAGALTAWLHVRQLGFGSPTYFQRRKMRIRAERERIARMSPAQFITEQIDPILDKIAKDGAHSLTRKERAVLRQSREKLSSSRR